MLKKYIGDKDFYRRVFIIAIPIIIQNGITHFVSLLDNIMVGQVGTLQMTAVSIINQLMFVFGLCIFGAMSGTGIFTAQFYGKKDNDGVRTTFQYKLITAAVLSVICLAEISAIVRLHSFRDLFFTFTYYILVRTVPRS